VIDATGAIYVIGGYNTTKYPNVFFNDVWASTDGGVHRTRAGCPKGVLRGYYRGYLGYYRGYCGSTTGGTWGTLVYQGVKQAYSRGTRGLP
jgi:hypothetical protein